MDCIGKEVILSKKKEFVHDKEKEKITTKKGTIKSFIIELRPEYYLQASGHPDQTEIRAGGERDIYEIVQSGGKRKNKTRKGRKGKKGTRKH